MDGPFAGKNITETVEAALNRPAVKQALLSDVIAEGGWDIPTGATHKIVVSDGFVYVMVKWDKRSSDEGI